ncbi:MAG: hypothetical protein WCP45_11155 [Verrucomicrobiota bacterium]
MSAQRGGGSPGNRGGSSFWGGSGTGTSGLGITMTSPIKRGGGSMGFGSTLIFPIVRSGGGGVVDGGAVFGVVDALPVCCALLGWATGIGSAPGGRCATGPTPPVRTDRCSQEPNSMPAPSSDAPNKLRWRKNSFRSGYAG